MKNKFLKLVLKDKREGNISSLLAGLLFLMIIIILIMFNYRVTMLSEVFYNIDDTITSAVLAASTPNKDAYIGSTAYPEQGQLVMQDTLTQSSYTNYMQGNVNGIIYNERVVIMSELNASLIVNGRHDAARLANPNNIKYKEDIVDEKRLGYTKYVSGDEFKSYTDTKGKQRIVNSDNKYAVKTINNLIGCTYTNLTQNLVKAPNITAINEAATLKGNFHISKDEVLNKAFLGNYLNSGMDVTRLEMYNIYRYTLAERHIYASPYMTYTVNGEEGYTWDGYNLDGTASTAAKITLSDGTVTNAVRDMVNATSKGSTTTINGISCTKANAIDIQIHKWIGPTVEDSASDSNDFKDLMKRLYPAMIIEGREPSHLTNITDSDYAMYKMMRALWKLDLAAWNDKSKGYSLLFWEDTGVTCQTTWWADSNLFKNKYGYLFNNNSKTAIKITDNILTTDEIGRKLLPIEGISVYAYVRDKEVTTTYINFSDLSDSSAGTSGVKLNNKVSSIKLGDFDANNLIDDKSTSGVIYEDRKKDGVLYYSGIYMEVAFEVIGFPRNDTGANSKHSLLNLGEFTTQYVTQARLVTVAKPDKK